MSLLGRRTREEMEGSGFVGNVNVAEQGERHGGGSVNDNTNNDAANNNVNDNDGTAFVGVNDEDRDGNDDTSNRNDQIGDENRNNVNDGEADEGANNDNNGDNYNNNIIPMDDDVPEENAEERDDEENNDEDSDVDEHEDNDDDEDDDEDSSLQDDQHNVMCDDCGVEYFTGTRYVAKHIYQYDICQVCIKDHVGVEDRYVAFDSPDSQADSVGPCKYNAIRCQSVRQGISKLRHHPTAHTFLLEHSQKEATEDEYKELQRLIASHNRLDYIYVNMLYQTSHGVAHSIATDQDKSVLCAIVNGIADSQNIIRVTFVLNMSIRQCSKVQEAFCHMLQSNKSLEIFCIQTPYHYPGTVNLYEKIADEGENDFIMAICDGLQSNKHIQRIRIETMGLVSAATTDFLCENVVKPNTQIKKVVFDKLQNKGDYRLQLYTACNRNDFMIQFTNPAATNKERIVILDKMKEYIGDMDEIYLIYYLIRKYPPLFNECLE